MNFKYIFTGGLILGTGFGLVADNTDDKYFKKRVISVIKTGISGGLIFVGWSLFGLGLTNPNS